MNMIQYISICMNIFKKNIESDCVSPKGNYRVKGYNTLYSYPYTKYDFWKSGEFNGYTPVYMYLGPNECKYYLYNPDGEVIAESDRKNLSDFI